MKLRAYVASMVCGIFLAAFSSYSHADEKVSKTDLFQSFVCGKMRKADLVGLKARLLENCNLDKPFSIAASELIGDTEYTYCCHKTK